MLTKMHGHKPHSHHFQLYLLFDKIGATNSLLMRDCPFFRRTGMKRKIVALMLAFTMIVSFAPALGTVYAVDEQVSENEAEAAEDLSADANGDDAGEPNDAGDIDEPEAGAVEYGSVENLIPNDEQAVEGTFMPAQDGLDENELLYGFLDRSNGKWGSL